MSSIKNIDNNNDGDEELNQKLAKPVVVDLTKEMYSRLDVIKKWYRSPSYSHTVRLLIEDTANGIESGKLKSHFDLTGAIS